MGAGQPPQGRHRMMVVPLALPPGEGDHLFQWALASRTSRRATAPGLERGGLALPHLGDWTQEGQPVSQGQEAMASLVAVSQSAATAKPRSAKPAPPAWPS